jgi:DNA/RNA endonuclease YhcR with UshA esterase domain
MNDKVAKWVNNTQIPAQEQIEIQVRASAMIAEAVDLLESIAVIGNEFHFGTIHLLKDALDEKGTFNFYPSLRNWRIGLVAQRDNELEKSPPQPQFLKGTKVRVKQGWRQHLRDTKPIVIDNYEAHDGEILTVQTYSPTRRDYSLTSDGMDVVFVHAEWLEAK